MRKRQARNKAMADMRESDRTRLLDEAQWISCRRLRIEILEDFMLEAAFDQYRHDIAVGQRLPGYRRNLWCATWWKPLRLLDIARYNIARMLRYLVAEKRDEQLRRYHLLAARAHACAHRYSLVDEWRTRRSADQSRRRPRWRRRAEERGGRRTDGGARADQKRHVPPCAQLWTSTSG